MLYVNVSAHSSIKTMVYFHSIQFNEMQGSTSTTTATAPVHAPTDSDDDFQVRFKSFFFWYLLHYRMVISEKFCNIFFLKMLSILSVISRSRITIVSGHLTHFSTRDGFLNTPSPIPTLKARRDSKTRNNSHGKPY